VSPGRKLSTDFKGRAGLIGRGQSSGPAKETEQTAGLDNYELLNMHDQIIRDQDEELGIMEKQVKRTKVQ